jgi:hypothetical protein
VKKPAAWRAFFCLPFARARRFFMFASEWARYGTASASAGTAAAFTKALPFLPMKSFSNRKTAPQAEAGHRVMASPNRSAVMCPEPEERGHQKPDKSPSHHDRENTRQEREKEYVKRTEQEEQRSGQRRRPSQ